MSTAPNTPTRKTSSTKPGAKSGSRSTAKPAGTAKAAPKAAPKATATVGPVTVHATTQRTSAAPAAPGTQTRRVLGGTPRAAAKPLLAAVGVADLAIEQVKDVQEAYVAEARKVQSRLAEVPQQVRTLPTQVRTIPAQVRSLRSEVEHRVDTVTERATGLYTSLTERGERLVTQIRRQPTTQAAIAEGKEALRQAEAAAAAAQKSFQAGERAVADAASTLG
jgi:hypothetical protein